MDVTISPTWDLLSAAELHIEISYTEYVQFSYFRVRFHWFAVSDFKILWLHVLELRWGSLRHAIVCETRFLGGVVYKNSSTLFEFAPHSAPLNAVRSRFATTLFGPTFVPSSIFGCRRRGGSIFAPYFY